MNKKRATKSETERADYEFVRRTEVEYVTKSRCNSRIGGNNRIITTITYSGKYINGKKVE